MGTKGETGAEMATYVRTDDDADESDDDVVDATDHGGDVDYDGDGW